VLDLLPYVRPAGRPNRLWERGRVVMLALHRLLRLREDLSEECILCQLCVNTCARNVLEVGFGLDRGRDALEHRPVEQSLPITAAITHNASFARRRHEQPPRC